MANEASEDEDIIVSVNIVGMWEGVFRADTFQVKVNNVKNVPWNGILTLTKTGRILFQVLEAIMVTINVNGVSSDVKDKGGLRDTIYV